MSLLDSIKTWTPNLYSSNRKWNKELLFIAIISLSINAFATDIQVTNANTSGAGSFDQAMQDFISAGTSGTISFDPSLSGSTITVASAYALSASSLTIEGDVNSDGISDITLQSDGNSHRLFTISGTATLIINHLSIVDFTSNSGGVINMSSGTSVLNITNSAFNDNSSNEGGVFNFSGGVVTIKNSIFNGNSASSYGGVFHYYGFYGGSVDIESSLFIKNTGNYGGGVIYKDFSANMIMKHVTCVGNSSSNGQGGAIYNSGGTLRLENSLFAGNSSRSGSADVHGGFDNAGGNVYGGASSNVADYFTDPANGDYSLISTSPAVNAGLNSLTTTANITTDFVGNTIPFDGIADIVDAGAYEFQGDPPIKFESSTEISSSTMTVTFTFNREITGLDNADFSSKEGDLSITSLTTSDNIEYTATFNLSDLSEKVIDTVFLDGLVEDLFTNNLQARDTFAFAYYVPVARVTNTNTSGEGSLDQALQDFIDSEGTVNTVEFDPSLSGSTIIVAKGYSFSQGSLLIDGDIDDDGEIDLTLKSDGANHGFFIINGSTSLSLKRVSIEDFSPSNQWGPVVQVNSSSASLGLEGCEVRNISTGGFGGAIYCENGNVSIKQTIFEGCSANWGGAVTIYSGGTTNIENSVFINNTAGLGGAIYGRNGANIPVRNCTFSGNSATTNGGAIYNLRILTVENSLFVNNTVTGTPNHIQNDATLNDNGGNIYGGENGQSNDVNHYFTDATGDDYSIKGNSSAVDGGDNTQATNAGITIDILGNPKPYVGNAQIVDVGAYEWQGDPDHEAPTVALATTSTSPLNDNPIPVTVTFNESVTGFESTDLTISGGTIDNFTGSADSYTFDLIPDGDGTLTVDVAANVATDVASNANTAATQLSIDYDGTEPTVTLATTSASPTNSNSIPVTITFTETVTGFESSDLTVSGGTIDNFTGSADSYAFDLIPDADGTLTVDLAADAATDAAGNGNTAANPLSIDHDGTVPTVTLATTSASPTNSSSIPVTITFTETVTGFESSDLTVSGGTIDNFTGAADSYAFDLIPDADGTLTVDLAADAATDAAENGNTAANQLSIVHDGTVPTVTLATTSASPTNSNSIPVTINFTETVTGLESSDLIVSGGTIDNFTGSANSYAFDLIPDADGTVTVDLAADAATDAAGNGNTTAIQLSIDYDATAPTATLATTSASPTNSNSIPVTINFTELVTGFEASDLTVSGGTIDNFTGSADSYAFDLIPDADGTMTVDLAADVAADAAGNGNTAAAQLSVDYDGTAPTVTLATTSASPTNSSSIPVTITFTETVTGFESSDLTVSGGTIDNFTGSANSYSFDLIPNADGTMTVDLAADVATDAAGNGNTAATQLSIDYDGTAPTVTLATTSVSPTNSNSIPVIITFNESVTGLESSDLIVSGGTIDNFTGAADSYSFDLIPNADGTLTVGLTADVATDAAGNGNTAATQLSVDYDGTVPTVTLATTSVSPTNSNSIPVTITFNESVTGLESSDLTVSGGTIDNFTGSADSYSFDLIPEADGTLTVDLAADAATDAAGNGNIAAAQLSTDHDGTIPTVTLATTSASPTNSNSIPVTISFTEVVSGFEASDLTVSGGTIDNFTGSADSYSFDLIPDADGTLTVDLAANLATDAAGNGNTAATQLSIDYDGTAPTVTLATTSVSPTNSNSIPVIITFNESVTGLESSDLIVSGGTIDNFTGAADSYSFNLIPNADGTLIVGLTADVATDAAGNGNTAATQLSIDYDGTVPTVTLATTSVSPTNSNSIPVTITFTETVTGLESSDLTVSGGTIDNFTGSANSYSFDLIPNADGTMTVDLAADATTDAAGNGNTAATQLSVDYDGTVPTVTLATTSASPTNSSSIPVNITFTETMTGFESSDLIVSGGTIDNFTGSANSYSFDLIPNADGTMTVDLAADAATDAAGNGNTAAAQLSVDYDETAPTVTLATTSVSPTNSNSIPVTITFTETVTGFESSDLIVSGGTIANFTGSADSYAFDLIPSADGTMTVDLAADAATDAAGNGNTAAAQLSVDYDETAPTVTLATTSVSPTNSNSIPVTITFTETVTGFESSDLIVSGGTIDNFTGSADSYAFDLIPDADGTLTVDLAADAATDAAGNGNTASTQLGVDYDGTEPTVTLATTSASPTNSNSIPVTITFTESVTGFEVSDLTVSGGTIDNFTGSADSYAFDLIPDADGTLTVDLAADVATDAAANGNTAAAQLSVDYDGTEPTVTLATTSASPTNSNSIPVTIAFTESVTGFEASDLTVSGGTIDNFTGSADSYAFDLIPDADGTMTVDLAADVATDAAGNGNTAAAQLSVDYDGTEPTVTLATTSASPTNSNSIPVTITFTESVTGFEASDLTVSGGTIDNFTGSADSYAFDLIPDADGTLTVDLAADAATDAAGNGNTAATQLSIDYDGTAPIITVDELQTDDKTPRLAGTIDDPDASVTITVDGQSISAVNEGDGTWTVEDNALFEIQAGTYDIVATAKDLAQNVGTDDTSNELTINSVLNVKELELELSIYPNPTTDQLSISTNFDHVEIERIEIIDVSGVSWKVPNIKQQLDVRGLSPGLYYIKLQIDGKVLSERFIKY